MSTPSGIQWCDLYPGSNSLDDLEPGFRSRLIAFLNALTAAGASYSVSATYRPPERAYLMHYCCLVAGYRNSAGAFVQISPMDVPKFGGESLVDIDWTHGGDVGAARAAAVEMRMRYGIAYPATLVSEHTKRLAIDMTIRWNGALSIRTESGSYSEITSLPRDGTNAALALVAKGYGVLKLATDTPHWSATGH